MKTLNLNSLLNSFDGHLNSEYEFFASYGNCIATLSNEYAIAFAALQFMQCAGEIKPIEGLTVSQYLEYVIYPFALAIASAKIDCEYKARILLLN